MSNVMGTMHRLLLVVMLMSTFTVNALQIDNLKAFANDKGESTFTITNDSDKRIYVNVKMSELTIKDGEIVEQAYTRENLSEWKIKVTPARTILDAGYEKDFKVAMSCGGICDKELDDIFKLSFEPSPYIEEGQENTNLMQIAIGFSPLFIKPGKDLPIDYLAEYVDGVINIKNRSKNYVKLTISSCSAEVKDLAGCTRVIHLLGGRMLAIPHSEVDASVKIELSTHRGEYKQEAILTHQRSGAING